MYRSALASGLLTFRSTLTNWQIIRRSLSLNIIDILKGRKIRATIR